MADNEGGEFALIGRGRNPVRPDHMVRMDQMNHLYRVDRMDHMDHFFGIAQYRAAAPECLRARLFALRPLYRDGRTGQHQTVIARRDDEANSSRAWLRGCRAALAMT